MPIGDIVVLVIVGLSVGWVAVAAIRSKRRVEEALGGGWPGLRRSQLDEEPRETKDSDRSHHCV